MKLRQGNVFTPVCQSFCSQGACIVGACVAEGACMAGGVAGEMSSAAGGTHPTGMLSCF